MFKRIEISGDPYERGQMYGKQAASEIALSVRSYEQIFEHYAQWGWSRVTDHARLFVDPIGAFGPTYLDELRGIADGAGIDFESILAINLRTEIMFAGKAASARATLPTAGECTSFAVVPPASSERTTFLGQNWDWTLHSQETVVLISAQRSDGPNYRTLVEAGLLAKTGLNDSGIGIVTNALVSSEDIGAPGVPYHLLLRALLDASTPGEALETLQRQPRSSSANYLIAHQSGVAINIEAKPGWFENLFLTDPDELGVVVHGNHFEHPRFGGIDVGRWLMPDSPFRVQRARKLLHERAEHPSAENLLDVLADHAGFPSSVCCHPVTTNHGLEQFVTVFGTVMDLTTSTFFMSEGQPCSGTRSLV